MLSIARGRSLFGFPTRVRHNFGRQQRAEIVEMLRTTPRPGALSNSPGREALERECQHER